MEGGNAVPCDDRENRQNHPYPARKSVYCSRKQPMRDVLKMHECGSERRCTVLEQYPNLTLFRVFSTPRGRMREKITLNGRGDWIRTNDPLLPKQVRYQAALRPDFVR